MLAPYEARQLQVQSKPKWKMLESNEFLLGREVAFELGDRFKPCSVYNCVTSNQDMIQEDRILLIGSDLQDIKENTNFSRITFLNVDNEEDPNRAYTQIKRLEFERFKVIPEGYMILSSSVENKEHIRVSKRAIKKGLDFATVGSLFIDHYKSIPGVNNVWMIFVVGDYPIIPQLVDLSHKVDDITNAFDHILKNIILDCEECPLNTICEDIEELRELHFQRKKEEKQAKEHKE